MSFFFLGTKTNVEVAQYVHDFLILKFRELWARYKDEAGYYVAAGDRQSYYAGLALGLEQQLAAKRSHVEQSMAIVVVEDPRLASFTASHFPKLRTAGMSGIRHRSDDALYAGTEEGRKLQIHRGVAHQKAAGPVLALGHTPKKPSSDG